jgi:20S proteasome subunit beta 4
LSKPASKSDLYGTKAILPYAAQGLGIYVALSTMDKYWYPDITRDEAVELLRKCIAEVMSISTALNEN